MRVYAKLYKNNRIIASHTAASSKAEPPLALLDCMEQVYKALDLSEPLWLSSHTRDLSRFARVKLLPGDFIEPVSFDFCEVNILHD